jgi:hypothetical protein
VLKNISRSVRGKKVRTPAKDRSLRPDSQYLLNFREHQFHALG